MRKAIDNLRTYLAGPMEYTNDNGLDWRLEYRDALAPLGISCVIPNFEEAELIPDVAAFNQLKIDDYQEYKRIMRLIAYKDNQFVNTVDFIITRWEGERMSGTIGEAHEAFFHAYTPNFLVTSLPFPEVPGWFGCCMEREFHTLDELIDYWKATNYLLTVSTNKALTGR